MGLRESMTIATARKMTLDEFLTYDDGTEAYYELVDGELVKMGAESTINTRIPIFLIKCFILLGIEIDRIGIKQMIAVPRGSATARDPDLMIHSEESARAIDGAKQACLRLGDPNPLLVIEVVSPGTIKSENYERDYLEKRFEYAARGILEFWLIDPQRDVVLVLVLDERGEYREMEFRGEEAIVSPMFPELKLMVNQVLAAR